MVKIMVDNRLNKADFEELMQEEGVTDLHLSGHMVAEYEQDKEDLMLDLFPEIERLTQNGIPCFADLSGRRSKMYGKESVRDLRRVDVRNLPDKTTVDMVKEAFPHALAVWKNYKFNYMELLFGNEEEACEAILSGQQKEINGELPYVMFHRENQAELTKRPAAEEADTSEQPPAKKQKVDTTEDDSEANGQPTEEATAVAAQ